MSVIPNQESFSGFFCCIGNATTFPNKTNFAKFVFALKLPLSAAISAGAAFL
jgi:hypothetical protein